jgi:hypothetical protein
MEPRQVQASLQNREGEGRLCTTPDNSVEVTVALE